MPTFSQRLGIVPMHKTPQIESLDDDLRASLWSTLCVFVWDRWEDGGSKLYRGSFRSEDAQEVDKLVRNIWFSLFKRPTDTIPHFRIGTDSVYGIFRKIVLKGTWIAAYDLIDYVAQHKGGSWQRNLILSLNHVLEVENAGYRFIDRQLAPITSPVEIQTIESVLQRRSKAVQLHLGRALELMSNRQSPDYRNSIKESISAVEAACQAIAGKPQATLNECLKEIKKSKDLHAAFEGALTKLYGYTSDAAGIRHALVEEGTKVTHADAQFMLVSCSAFINYLWSIAAETGIAIK